MPKIISQRGFKISKGDIDRYYISYSIDKEGLENISVHKDFNNYVSITSDGEDIKSISFQSPQLSKYISISPEEIKELFGGKKSPDELIKEELEQALAIYHEVRRILNVDEKLKDYLPRFSHESEFNLYNILGIDDVSQLESLIWEGK